MEYIAKLRNAMIGDGITCNDEIIADGNLHRFHVNGDSLGTQNGWYVVFNNTNVIGGAYGCWKRDISKNWCSKDKTALSPEEWSQHSRQIEIAKLEQSKVKEAIQLKAKEYAKQIWFDARPADDNHPYLVKKRVRSHQLRLDSENRLIVPLFDMNKQLQSLQFITPDGVKRFLAGSITAGKYFILGEMKNPTDNLYIGEGYSTCATIYEATGCAVACAFYCDNLSAVTQVMREKFPWAEIIILADNDAYSDGNPGLTKAQEVSRLFRLKFVRPNFTDFDVSQKPTDFNDLMVLGGVERVKEQLESQISKIDDWPNPEEIDHDLLPVELLPIELIPEPLREFIIDESQRMQCPPDYITIPLLIVISTIVGTSCGIKPKKEDEWMVIPNLWGCLIGLPGRLKTPAASAAMYFLEQLELEGKKVFEEAMRQYQIELDLHKTQKEGVKKAIANAHTKAASNIGDLEAKFRKLREPEKPKRKRFKSNDASLEKLSELLAENPAGILLSRDELMGLLTTWDKPGHESDRAFFLETWNGTGSHTTDRIGRGTIDTPNMCLSIFGTTQPDKLIRYLRNAIDGNNDGLIQRFQLLVFPDGITWELIDRKPNVEARTRVFQIIRSLSEMCYLRQGANIDHNEKHFFRFSNDGQEIFYEWLTELENKKLRSDEHPLLLEHLAKFRKLMPALALIFHLIDLADDKQANEISSDNAKKAIGICNYLESHARRIYDLVANLDQQSVAILADKIKKGKLKDGFTVRDVYRQRGLLKDKKLAKAACEELVEAGWLREVETPPSQGQRQKITYLINPKVKRNK